MDDATDGGPGARRPGIPVGRIAGVPVFLTPSWFLVAVLVTFLYVRVVRGARPDAGPEIAYGVAFAFAVLLLLSVLVHEVAHSLAARATGTPASHIVLDVWGGHTAFARDSTGPWRSIVVAAVGPASNGVLAVAAWGAAGLTTPGSLTGILLTATGTANAVVAAFNALPGLPLDGGRVLEGLVWRATGDRLRGTVVAGVTGRIVAVGLVLFVVLSAVRDGGLGISRLWLLLIAWLLWQGAGQAISAARWRRKAGRARARDLLHPAVAVPSTTTLGDALRRSADAGGPRAAVVLDIYGRPAAVVDERAAATVPASRVDGVPAMSVAEALGAGAVVQSELAGEDLLDRLRAAPARRYVVVDPGGTVVGVLNWDDVARFVADA